MIRELFETACRSASRTRATERYMQLWEAYSQLSDAADRLERTVDEDGWRIAELEERNAELLDDLESAGYQYELQRRLKKKAYDRIDELRKELATGTALRVQPQVRPVRGDRVVVLDARCNESLGYDDDPVAPVGTRGIVEYIDEEDDVHIRPLGSSELRFAACDAVVVVPPADETVVMAL